MLNRKSLGLGITIIGEWLLVLTCWLACSTEEIRLDFSLLHFCTAVLCTLTVCLRSAGETIQAKDVLLFARWHRKIGQRDYAAVGVAS